MKFKYPLILFPLIFFFTVARGALSTPRDWQQGVRYEISAELDTSAQRLNSHMQLVYRNNSPDTLTQIFLQVPSNAFHDEDNTAVREMKRFSGDNIDFGQPRGYKLTIESLQFLSIGDETEFPLQAYDFSDTILDLVLPYPLAPGDTLALGLQFHQNLNRDDRDGPRRRRNRRQRGDEEAPRRKSRLPTSFINWFPRVAVYDKSGWHAEPFHFMMQPGDVYSEFADLDVTLTVPGNFIVAASGEVADGDPGWSWFAADTNMTEQQLETRVDSLKTERQKLAQQNGTREVRFRASKLRDFIFAASPDFTYFKYENDFPIHLFATGGDALPWIKSVGSRLPTVVKLLTEHYGAYSFSQLSLVRAHGRNHAQPMLIFMDEDSYYELAGQFSEMMLPGVVGTNGVKESWLATGMQFYMAKVIAEKMYGKRGYSTEMAQEDMNWLERQYPLPSVDDLLRNFTHLYNSSGQNEQISKPIHEYHDPIGAVMNVYAKSELFYEMLRYVVGEETFKESWREIVRRHAQQNISAEEVQIVFEEKHGAALDWFFDQWLQRTPTVDYSKKEIKKYRRDDGTWVTEVAMQRNSDGIMPVDVEVELDGGEKMVKRWDGKSESGTVVFETEEKPKAVNVDPQDRIMDSNRLNNARPRIEIRPDWPLLRYVHMPNDALLVLWRPMIDYNDYDSVRLGLRAASSYRAFYHNVTVELVMGVKSAELDGKLAYSHPFSKSNLLNRYKLMARKNEGRFETHLSMEFYGSKGFLANSSRSLVAGVNFSGLLNEAYTFRDVASDTGAFRFAEWEDADVLLGFLEGNFRHGIGRADTEIRAKVEWALPGGDAQFVKLSSRLTLEGRGLGLKGTVRGNLATSFGPDRLPLQDRFFGEGASARERFQNDILKTGESWDAFERRLVEGGGFLRGYVGQPLPAEEFTTVNLELTTAKPLILGIRLFGFYDTGRIWTTRSSDAFTRSDAGFGLSLFGDEFGLFGGNVSLFQDLSAKVFFPIWLSHPLPGEKSAQFRWYVSLGKTL